MAPGDVTFEPVGQPPMYLDVVISARSTHRNMSPAASAYHSKLVARHRFLHPRGWSYYATLRRKLRWYEGVV